MILITGATGHLGKSVVDQLLTKTTPNKIAILARDAEKAKDFKAKGIDVRIGDFDNSNSLNEALKGIEKVLLISGVDPVNRLQQHKNVIDAAKLNGVKLIAYTSVTMENFSNSDNQFLMGSHFLTEDYIKESGLAFTFFRNNLYTDTILMFAGENPFETGITLPTAKGKVGFALRREIGEAIANDLLSNYNENKIYEITGSEAYSYADVASELSKLSGKTVTYTELESEDYKGILEKAGVPEHFIQVFTAFAADIKNNQHSKVTSDLEILLGRKPINFSSALKELYKL
ncbi:NAD(P)H dehydrogenase (quinone) [Flavobacterium fluvii]|uniref:NAD(P)H dehydrogenase (Quinone) n=1 Tax=Flavobacterium fluvii TaxID=468056 RepID=A0A1M5FGJ9_9FLAO|nr:SDR family oxidoreductase [Flavobacterium fluvii]SHF90687.1 NAD(P)H dehydrogenase (quinone) [Flavobacterium fluvii]